MQRTHPSAVVAEHEGRTRRVLTPPLLSTIHTKDRLHCRELHIPTTEPRTRSILPADPSHHAAKRKQNRPTAYSSSQPRPPFRATTAGTPAGDFRVRAAQDDAYEAGQGISQYSFSPCRSSLIADTGRREDSAGNHHGVVTFVHALHQLPQ